MGDNFNQTVFVGLLLGIVTATELSNKFECSMTTIRSWALGKSRPGPAVSELVIKFIEDKY